MREKQQGFTLLDMAATVVMLGLIVAVGAKSLMGPKEAAELQAINEQALDLVNYAEQIRITPTNVTPANIIGSSAGVYTRSYMSLALGSTVEEFRAEIINQHGFIPRPLPSTTHLDTPYLVYMTADQVYVETTIPFEDVNLPRASESVVDGETTLRFYPSVDSEGSGTSRSASSRFTQSFMSESPR